MTTTDAGVDSSLAVDSLAIVVCIDGERGIGKDGTIPWRVPADIRHFKRLTRSTRDPDARNAVIMGRATWESIPERFRPLTDRLNLVLSRRPSAAVPLPEGVLLCASLAEALEQAHTQRVERTFVIGGGQVYAETLRHPGCQEIYLTRLTQVFACDTHFPDLPPAFQRAEELQRGVSNGVEYCVERWYRKPS